MDGRRFDAWTRSFSGASRRDAIKGLVAGLTAGPLALAGIRGVTNPVEAAKCGKQGDRCNKTNDCCKDFRCKNDTCKKDSKGCGKRDARCSSGSDCCNNYECRNSKCKKKESGGGCGKKGDNCQDNADCCKNFRCKNDRCKPKN